MNAIVASSATPPGSLAELYARAPQAAATLIGATSHVAGVGDGETLGHDCRFVEAVFIDSGPTVIVSRVLGARLDQLLNGEYTSNVLWKDGRERWQLTLAKGDLAVLFHECVHGVGVADPALARGEWTTYWQYPYVRALTEGVNELVSRFFLNRFIVALGLHLVDARLLEVRPIRRGFVAEAEAVRALAAELARVGETTLEDEVVLLARDGAAKLACWRLADRIAGLPEFAAAGLRGRPDRLLTVRAAIEDSLGRLGVEWGEGADEPGLESDVEAGRSCGESVMGRVREAVRRVQAGPGGLPDVDRLAAELVKAAAAAMDHVGAGLDAVSDALRLLETGDSDDDFDGEDRV